MADLIVFTPRVDLTVQQNLDGFIASTQDEHTAFGKRLDFFSDVWDITDTVKQRGLTHRNRISFSNLETVREAAPQPMAEPFKSFAKAFIRYMQGIHPVISVQNRLGALRALEQAVSEITGTAQVEGIDLNCLNRAAQLVKEHWGAKAAYRVGGQLEIIAKFLTENRLIRSPVKWVNSIPRPLDTERIGAEADKLREERLPSATALEAVATAFRIAQVPADVVIASTAAIMCSAPDRINEVLTLPIDCEVRRDHEGLEAYGLRWWPSKGAEPMVKWVLPMMQGVVQEAVAKLRQATEHARSVAAWYESNPRKLWLPEHLECLRGTLLTMAHAKTILGVRNAKQWLDGQPVQAEMIGGRLFVQFENLEQAAVALLPDGFPIADHRTGLRFSQALFVVNSNFFSVKRPTLPWMIEAVNQQHISDGLGARVEHGVSSVFTRLGLMEGDGTPISINTHGFRHYLNTLAQQGGLSQLDIAKWSGRKDIRQNSAYDHVPATALLARVQEAVGGEVEFYGALDQSRPNMPRLRSEFARLAIKTAHTTDFGYCVHDFTMMPCQLHADCINCADHVCVKGDPEKTSALRKRLDETRQMLAQATAAAGEGRTGANRWVAHHRMTVGRLEQLIEVLDDPALPKGSIVQMGGVEGTSRVAQAEELRRLAAPAHAPAAGKGAVQGMPDGIEDMLVGTGGHDA